MFEMKPEYYIGIDMIDQEHKQLFDYASEAYELLQEEFTPDKYDKIDAIVCQNDDGALGVVEALKSAGKLDSIQVLGIDGSDDALQSIQDGEMTMTALQDAKAQAEAGADIFEKLKKGTDPADIEDVNIPFKIVTKDNVADYLSK